MRLFLADGLPWAVFTTFWHSLTERSLGTVGGGIAALYNDRQSSACVFR